MTSVVWANTVGGLLNRLCSAPATDAAAVLDSGRELSGSGFAAAVSQTARALSDLGIDRSRRIGLVAPNSVDGAAAILGTMLAGICVPLNPDWTARELTEHLRSLEVDMVAVTDDVDRRPFDALRQAGWRPQRLPSYGRTGAPPRDRTTDFAHYQPVSEPPRDEDVCLLLATSGTTARPKTVALTHGNLLVSAEAVAGTLRLSRADRAMTVMPLFHIHGLVAGLLAPLVSGGSVYLLATKDPDDIVEVLQARGITWYSGVPTLHRTVVEAASRKENGLRHTLRFVRSCSSPLPIALAERIEQVLGVPVVEAYGMTEASHQITSNPLPPGIRVPGSVGLPDGAAVRVVDDCWNDLPPHTTGNVIVRGGGVIRRYHRDDTAGTDAFHDGWMKTGDEGYVDDRGYLYLRGRTKEIVNRGGEKIFPREIDEVLTNHPAVAQAQAFALAHPRLGEDVGAAVVLREGAAADAAELKEFASRFLAHFKVPRVVVFVSAIPSGPTGKAQRIGLARRLGLAGAD